MNRKRVLSGATVAIVATALFGAMAHAEDFGNWSHGCSSGNVCFYEVGPSDGVVNQASTRDSNFPNNLAYSNGDNMNDRVNYISNLFISNISIQAYTNAGYVGVNGFCLAHNTAEAPLSGVSAYKSC